MSCASTAACTSQASTMEAICTCYIMVEAWDVHAIVSMWSKVWWVVCHTHDLFRFYSAHNHMGIWVGPHVHTWLQAYKIFGVVESAWSQWVRVTDTVLYLSAKYHASMPLISSTISCLAMSIRAIYSQTNTSLCCTCTNKSQKLLEVCSVFLLFLCTTGCLYPQCVERATWYTS